MSVSPKAKSRTEAFLILNAISGIGWITMKKLLRAYHENPIAIFSDKEEHYRKLGLSESVSQRLAHWYEIFSLEKELERMDKLSVRFISFEEEDYPPLLKTIYDPPIGLYTCGNVKPFTHTIAIVGSRFASPYGLQVAERFACELAERGWCVVSGFARGIDTAAHRGALRTKGLTVGVLGCSIDRIYPPENADLYNELRQSGCLLSEFRLGSRADRMSFPRRNRILSGMSQAILVVESDIKGGSMLTASFAVEQNRQVFAIPGSIHSDMSRGCHLLIRNGATLVTSVEDILEDLSSAPPLPLQLELGEKIQNLHSEDEKNNLSPDEIQICELIKTQGPMGSSELAQHVHFSAESLQLLLFSLELKHMLVRRPDGLFEI